MLSRLIESEPSVCTMGRTASMSSIGDAMICSRARAQLRLPCTVLISPLWARKRNGCASFHCGHVLVEKRWWKTARLDSKRGSLRSRKKAGRFSGVTRPL